MGERDSGMGADGGRLAFFMKQMTNKAPIPDDLMARPKVHKKGMGRRAMVGEIEGRKMTRGDGRNYLGSPTIRKP